MGGGHGVPCRPRVIGVEHEHVRARVRGRDRRSRASRPLDRSGPGDRVARPVGIKDQREAPRVAAGGRIADRQRGDVRITRDTEHVAVLQVQRQRAAGDGGRGVRLGVVREARTGNLVIRQRQRPTHRQGRKRPHAGQARRGNARRERCAS